MIRFLLKGLWRDRTRSLFPFLTVVTGVTITVFMQAYLSGLTSNMSQSSATFSTGHLKIASRAYVREGDQAPNELAYLGVDALLAELRAEAPELIWAPRIRFAGLLDVPDERGETRAQAPVTGLGIGLLSEDSPDRRMLDLQGAIVRGRMPAASGEILVSDDLARYLGVEPGATATLISSTMYGGMAVSNFTVAGTVGFGIRALDRGTILVDLGDIQAALDMEDAAGEILGFFPDSVYRRDDADALEARLNARWGDADDDFAPAGMAMHSQPGMAEMMDYLGAVTGAIVGVFVFVMSIVLWNAGLVGSLRRYGEIGLRLAFGEHKGRLYRATIAESLAIWLFGSMVGTLVGLVPAYWLQSQGFDISSLMPNSSMMMDNVIRAQITATTFFIGFLPGLLATGIGTAIAGIGVYRRQTASLIKELEA